MKTKYKKELKLAIDLVVDDNIKVGGLLCTVTKAETVFYYTEDSTVRLTLAIVGATPKKRAAVLFLPRGMPITILK